MPFKTSARLNDRFGYPPSTAATLNLAASAAQMARLVKPFDADYAARCLEAAERAWKAARDTPEFKYGRIPGPGGGNYDDFYLEDEYYWAASELFITTGKDEYKGEITKALEIDRIVNASSGANGPIHRGNVATLAHLSLLQNPDLLESAAAGTAAADTPSDDGCGCGCGCQG